MVAARLAPAVVRRPARPTPRSVAPDDDEDFLRDLNRRNRRRDQDKPNEQPTSTPRAAAGAGSVAGVGVHAPAAEEVVDPDEVEQQRGEADQRDDRGGRPFQPAVARACR